MQPDVEAAAGVYGGAVRLGVRGQRRATSTAQLRGRDVAGDRPLAPGVDPPPQPAWITQVSVETAEAPPRRVERAGGTRDRRPARVRPRPPRRRSPTRRGAVFNAWEPRDAPRRAARQRAGRVGDEPARHAPTPTPPPRSTARCSAGRPRPSARHDVPPARLRRRRARAARLARGRRRDGAGASRAARWLVDFWVDDVDAAVARSERGRRHDGRGRRSRRRPGARPCSPTPPA